MRTGPDGWGGGDSGMVISPGHSLRALHDSPPGHCVLGLTGRSVSPGSQGTDLRLTVGSPHREKRPAVLLGPPKGLPPRSQGRGPEEESKNPGGSGNRTQDLPVTSRSTLPLDHDGRFYDIIELFWGSENILSPCRWFTTGEM